MGRSLIGLPAYSPHLCLHTTRSCNIYLPSPPHAYSVSFLVRSALICAEHSPDNRSFLCAPLKPAFCPHVQTTTSFYILKSFAGGILLPHNVVRIGKNRGANFVLKQVQKSGDHDFHLFRNAQIHELLIWHGPYLCLKQSRSLQGAKVGILSVIIIVISMYNVDLQREGRVDTRNGMIWVHHWKSNDHAAAVPATVVLVPGAGGFTDIEALAG
ncbi:hypothetical protein EV424DRAFT_1347420 [Suillus variegatus]|nr:hypothetical protein EV424DRAFT_1347420 [Suillus variegatus]